MTKSEGLTFIEILVAIFILALIAGSLLTAYGFSFKHNKEAELLLKATFVAQTKMEMLQSMDALSAYYEGSGQVEQDSSGYYIQTLCQPYISEDCHLFSIVLKDKSDAESGYMLYAVPPEGKDVLLLNEISGDTAVSLSIAGNSYSMGISGSEQSFIEGLLPDDTKKIMVVINAIGYSGNHRVTFSFNTGGREMEAKVYDTSENSSRLTVLGINEQRYHNFAYRNYSMVRAQIRVFDTETGVQPKVVLESILQLEN